MTSIATEIYVSIPPLPLTPYSFRRMNLGVLAASRLDLGPVMISGGLGEEVGSPDIYIVDTSQPSAFWSICTERERAREYLINIHKVRTGGLKV
jgi:hypothetical protein